MRPTLRLGRIAGIPVGVHWGALVIVALIAVGLSMGSLPNSYPGRSAAAYLLAGLVAATLFVASLLAHELAHALLAQRNGVEVDSITLWLLGGVAQLRGEPANPRSDFVIAAVGPAASIVLGLLFGGLAAALSAAGVGGLVAAVPAYLAVANILLALFNLIPAAPLDGGRVLRSALWARHGDRTRATVTAAQAGRLFGYALIVLGIGQALLLSQFNGLWLALIGWFLVHAATAEAEQASAARRLAGIRVSDVMTPQPMTATPTATVDQFINNVALQRMFSSYPLVDDHGRLAGLVTLNRLRAVAPENRNTTRLADIACAPADVPPAKADMPLTELLPRMAGCADGRAVVTDPDGRVVGLVSPSDISRAITRADLRGTDPYPPRGADLNSARPEDGATRRPEVETRWTRSAEDWSPAPPAPPR